MGIKYTQPRNYPYKSTLHKIKYNSAWARWRLTAGSKEVVEDQLEMTMVWRTTSASESVTLPATGTNNFEVDWGDGTVETITTASPSHTYATPGDHLITLDGACNIWHQNDGGDKVKLIKVLNLGDMGWTSLTDAFRGCANLTSFAAGDTDMSSVTDLSYMFFDCTNLVTIDLGSSFDTSSCSVFGSMFRGCSSLITLDLGDLFDVSFSTTSLVNMFYDCSSLTTLDLGSAFDTSSCTNISNMFFGCSSLTTLDLGDLFDTSSVVTMNAMFRNCSSLTSLDLGDLFDTSSCTNMLNMFYGCTNLTTLDLGDLFDTSSCTSMLSMFWACSNLTTLDLGGLFDTSSVTRMDTMFRSCSSLTSFGAANFDVTSLEKAGSMFLLSSLSDAEYDDILVAWSAQTLISAVPFSAGTAQYTETAARLILTDPPNSWVITDGGAA